MEKILQRLQWLIRQKGNIDSLKSQLKGGDNPELTNFLKSNPTFVNAAKSFHSWKEGLKKEMDQNLIEDGQIKKGPASKGFKKRDD
jgi:hypothetical protein